MKTLTLSAEWTPKLGFQPGRLHVEGKLTDQGSAVWRDPQARVIEKPEPSIADDEVLIRVRACGSRQTALPWSVSLPSMCRRPGWKPDLGVHSADSVSVFTSPPHFR